MRLRSIGVAMLGLLLAGVGTAWAQVSTTGTIQVIVEDPREVVFRALPSLPRQPTSSRTVRP